MRAALYARVSTSEQADQGTIETQVSFLKKHCQLHEIEVAGVYPDEDVSGTVDLPRRPHGARLLADARSGLFDVLLVWKVDRLARSVKVFYDALTVIEAEGVVFKSGTEPIDTGTPIGRLMMTMLAAFAAMERDTILERTMSGKLRAAANGHWIGGPPPFGYRVQSVKSATGEERMAIVPSQDKLPCGYSEAEIVQLIYAQINVGRSTQQVCDYLTSLGIPCPANCRAPRNSGRAPNSHWRGSTVVALARSTTPRGEHWYRDIARPVPPLVTQETWEAAQEALTARRHGGRGGERDYLLRGLVKCGTCGHTYGGTSWMGGKHRGPDLWYYQCCGAKSWKRLHPDQPRCKSPTVNGPKLEAALWRQVVRMTEDREATLAQVEKGCEKARQEAVQRLQELGRLQTALDGLQGSRERVNAALVVGAMTAAEAKDWKERLAAQEMDLRRQQSEIQEQWEAANRRQETVARAGRALDLLTEAVAGENTFEDRQLALSLAVEEVRVYPDRVRRPRVEVKLALKDTAESAECSRWRLCGKFAVSLNLAA